MVWSQPDDDPPSPVLPSPPSRRRNRRSSTSTIFTTTTGYTRTTNTLSRNPSPQPSVPLAYAPSETTNRTYTQPSQSYISPTPHASQEVDELIPSAQPTTPIFSPATQAFSASDEPSPLPSPPESIPDIPSEVGDSRRTSSFGSSRRRRSSTPAAATVKPETELGLDSQQRVSPDIRASHFKRGQAQTTTDKESPRSRGKRGRGRARGFHHSRRQASPQPSSHPSSSRFPQDNDESQPTNPKVVKGRARGREQKPQTRNSNRRASSPQQQPPPSSELEDSLDMSTLLEGIGRMHIAMDRDPAGRWRIKRYENEYD